MSEYWWKYWVSLGEMEREQLAAFLRHDGRQFVPDDEPFTNVSIEPGSVNIARRAVS